MKCLLIALCLLPFCLYAQENEIPDLPVFDKNFYDCENQWVVFPKKPGDTAFAYGVIYIDATAGFTFDYQGNLKIGTDGKFTGKKNEFNTKYRLEANTSKVALLSNNKLAELGQQREPAWLKIYQTDPNKLTTMVAWGQHYNQVEAYDKALGFLLKAYAIDPHAPKLEFELAYNYNATEQLEKAIDVLKIALKNDPKNFWFYRELGYAYMHQKKLGDAESTYLKGIEFCNDNGEKLEMAYNMAYGYFTMGNKPKFSEWYDKTKGYVSDANSIFLKNLMEMSERLK